MIVAVDTSPFVLSPRSGVARALSALLTGLRQLSEAPTPVLLAPEPGESPRLFRRRLPGLVKQSEAEVFLSPWSAFPRLHVPVVVIVHELPFVKHGNLEGRVRGVVHRRWLRLNATENAALVVPSKATREDLLTLFPGAASRVHVIPNGFDPGPWQPREVPPDDPPYAVMVGLGPGKSGARKKGLDVLLKAWRDAALSGWKLKLVGRPGLAVPADVDVHVALTDEVLQPLVAGASMLVYPSRSEGFGYPPLEAMACGVPVLATDAAAISETVADAALVVEAGDVEAFSAGLTRLAGEEALRHALRAAGLERASAFPPEKSAAAFAALFEDLAVRA